MSRTLTGLLSGILTGKPVHFRACDPSSQDAVTQLLPRIPLPLSQRQQQAVRNAWSSDLSYVQGPPGTGKSHTIAAMMLSSLLMHKRTLLVSHKKAAIDVVRAKLRELLDEDLTIYVGTDTDERAKTRAKIQALIDEVRTHGFQQRLASVRALELEARKQCDSIMRQMTHAHQSLAGALTRAHGVYQAQQEHLLARAAYRAGCGDTELSAEVLARLPRVEPRWEEDLNWLGDVGARRASGEAVTGSERLRARVLLCKYQHRFGAAWIPSHPWDIHRIQSHYAAIHAFDRARIDRQHIQVDLAQLRISLADLDRRSTEANKKYIKTLFRRLQIEHAAYCISDLTNFAALFRLRAPRLVRPRMQAIDYSNITKVFPLWLGEMRDLGAVLPLQPGLFDLAIVDEASQVNIAEVVPAFFRADSFVVVGDPKQLGLEAAGLFALNRTFEQLTWDNCFGGMSGVISYADAHRRQLAVSTSSILNFIESPSNGLVVPKATLDEHFRSMPRLASFTSTQFYADDGGLKIMTEVSENLGKDCFRLIEVGGTRADDGKYVANEVEQALELVKNIASGRELGNNSALRLLGFRHPDRLPTVGIISFTTMQRDVLREKADDRIDEQSLKKLDLFIGTPEEFQGNERDVIVLTFALGRGQRYSASHYEKPSRFNVATSRARKFTYAVIGCCPPGAMLLRRYFAFFGFHAKVQLEITDGKEEVAASDVSDSGARMLWRLDERLCESEFEQLLLRCLQQFMDRHNNHRLKLFNQVTTCGQKRVDFVMYDEDTRRAVAVEVDGPDHFCADGRTYHQEHLDRVAVLRRAGWKLVHVPYFKWYRDGWICEHDQAEFSKVLAELYSALLKALELSSETNASRPIAMMTYGSMRTF